jgi:hypothetical protein
VGERSLPSCLHFGVGRHGCYRLLVAHLPTRPPVHLFTSPPAHLSDCSPLPEQARSERRDVGKRKRRWKGAGKLRPQSDISAGGGKQVLEDLDSLALGMPSLSSSYETSGRSSRIVMTVTHKALRIGVDVGGTNT